MAFLNSYKYHFCGEGVDTKSEARKPKEGQLHQVPDF